MKLEQLLALGYTEHTCDKCGGVTCLPPLAKATEGFCAGCFHGITPDMTVDQITERFNENKTCQ